MDDIDKLYRRTDLLRYAMFMLAIMFTIAYMDSCDNGERIDRLEAIAPARSEAE